MDLGGAVPSPGRSLTWAVVAAVAAFWLLVFVAGSLNPGYAPSRDYVSALASRGARSAWLGVTALVVLPMAHLGVAAILRRRAPVVAGGLVACVLAGLVVASMRISCPRGAAGCSVGGQLRRTDWLDATHGRVVAVYGVVMVAVLVTITVTRWSRARGVAAASAVLAPVSGLLLLMSTGGAHPGLPQRLWLLVNTGWLVLVAVREGGS